MSEIDNIFASKGKVKSTPSVPSSSALPEKTKKKHKKRTSATSSPANLDASTVRKSSAKRPAPETVIDPSSRIISAKRLKTDKAPPTEFKGKSTISGRKPEQKVEDKFKDSRGTGPRRKTDEGWSIYKEDELGIGDAGGDTPLCPFDCECCF